jgi:hypothetical protein
MAAVISLGTFEQVALREAWPTEDGNFTPWLAEPGNIALLGRALNMELETAATEQRVGSFRADILARATDEEDHQIIVENQFGRTDHSHLGQILTYLAGVQGTKTVVWIAEKIQSDHRAAIDWLNTNTSEEFSFFAIEIELWRIGNSAPAPRFNVIASPNDWARTTRRVAREVSDGVLAPRFQVRLAYWASFAEFLRNRGAQFFHIRGPRKSSGYRFPIGRPGFFIRAGISTANRCASVSLYMPNDAEHTGIRILARDKDLIQAQIGQILEWNEAPGKKRSSISVVKQRVNPSDEHQYEDIHEWMLESMETFRKVFSPRVMSLPAIAGSYAVDGDDSSDE